MPTISVIVPVYKVEPYLRRCVDSILAQTFTDFELILVDDGSPDNCGAICDEYAQKDSRVYVIHQENGGLSAARNAGIDWVFANSGSEWLSFVDSDDWVHPKYLEILYHSAKENDVQISSCMIEKVYEREQLPVFSEGETINLDVETAYEDHYGMMVLATTKIYSKALFARIRFPVGRICEDSFVTHQLLFACDRVAIVPSVMYYYFQHTDSIMNLPWRPQSIDEIEAREKRLDYLKSGEYPKALDKEARIYVWQLRRHLEQIQTSHWKASKYERLLRNKLKIALIRYRKIINFADNKWIYESAYPRLMNTYWRACSAINRVRKMLKRE